MDGISTVGATSSYTMQPQLSATSDTTASTTPAQDEVVLSGGEDTATANTYSGPDAAFTTLLQSDPGLAQDYVAENQFGFQDSVLSSDDTLDASSASQSNSTSQTTTTATTDPAALAAKVELGALNFNSGVASALLGDGQTPDSVFFMGASMSNLLTANGSAALAYLTPQAAGASGTVDLTG